MTPSARMRAGAGAAALLALALGWRALVVMWRAAELARVRSGAVTTIDPHASNPDLLVVAARRAAQGGDAAQAATTFARVVALRPLDAESRLRLGAALAASGKPAEASAQIEAATRIARNHPQLLIQAAGARIALWRAGGDLGELRRALGCLRDGLQRDPGRLAEVQAVLGDDLATPENLARVLPDTPVAWRSAAGYFARRGQWEAAAAAYERAGALGDEPAVQALARAAAAARTGDAATALQACESAVSAAGDPDRPHVIRSAARVLQGLPADQRARGMERLTAWAARWPIPPAAALALARWRAATGDLAGALEVLSSLPAAVADDPDVLHTRATVSERAGQHEAAALYFERARDARPGEVEGWLAYIRFLERRGRLEAALREANRARGRHAEDPRIQQIRKRLIRKTTLGK